MAVKVKIKRFDKSLPLPGYQSPGAACVDLVSRIDVNIPSREVGYVPLNVAMELPKGYWGMLIARSSMHRMGLIPANGIGVVDTDFCGNDDEYKLIVYNFRNSTVNVRKGVRIAQFMLARQGKIEFKEVSVLKNKNRGGIGSTGE